MTDQGLINHLLDLTYFGVNSVRLKAISFPGLKCEATYWPGFLSSEEAWSVYRHLVDEIKIPLHKIEIVGQGTFTMDTGKIMLLDENLYQEGVLPPEQWGKTSPWSSLTLQVRDRVERLTGHHFHTGVCIRYPDGNTGVAYHHDPPAFGDTTYVASLSLGAERNFMLREKATGQEHPFLLAHGSLFLMGRHCQDLYEHAVPYEPEITGQRVNITFRRYGFPVGDPG